MISSSHEAQSISEVLQVMRLISSCVSMQVPSKLLQAGDGMDIIYQHEQIIDYNEVSLLLQKVGPDISQAARYKTHI